MVLVHTVYLKKQQISNTVALSLFLNWHSRIVTLLAHGCYNSTTHFPWVVEFYHSCTNGYYKCTIPCFLPLTGLQNSNTHGLRVAYFYLWQKLETVINVCMVELQGCTNLPIVHFFRTQKRRHCEKVSPNGYFLLAARSKLSQHADSKLFRSTEEGGLVNFFPQSNLNATLWIRTIITIIILFVSYLKFPQISTIS